MTPTNPISDLKSLALSGGWQPIETAPMNGTEVLVIGTLQQMLIPDPRRHVAFYSRGWWSGRDVVTHVTHWMALPTAPGSPAETTLQPDDCAEHVPAMHKRGSPECERMQGAPKASADSGRSLHQPCLDSQVVEAIKVHGLPLRECGDGCPGCNYCRRPTNAPAENGKGDV